MVALNKHLALKDQGRYVLSASYTDNGGAITPLTKRETIVLRPAKVQAEDADMVKNITRSNTNLGAIHNQSFFMLRGIDLKGINSLSYFYSSANRTGTIEVRLDSPKGDVISTVEFTPTGNWDTFKTLNASLTAVTGKHNLYFVFVKTARPNNDLITVDYVNFNKAAK